MVQGRGQFIFCEIFRADSYGLSLTNCGRSWLFSTILSLLVTGAHVQPDRRVDVPRVLALPTAPNQVGKVKAIAEGVILVRVAWPIEKYQYLLQQL